MSQPVFDPAIFAQFQAFMAAQNAGGSVGAIGQFGQEKVLPSFRDVLKTLVNKASLASETVEHDFHAAVDKYLDDLDVLLNPKTDEIPAEVPTVPAPVV